MSQQTITVKAFSDFPVKVAGKFLSIIACTASFKVEMDQSGRVVAVSGSQLSKQSGFSKLNFTETNGADNVITFDVSDTPSPGRAMVVAANSSTFVGANSGFYDFGTTPNPTGITFPGIDSGGRERRVIYITNSGRNSIGSGSATGAVLGARASGGGNGISIIIQPGTTQAIETNADITILSYAADLSAGPTHLAGSVLEIFYSKPLQTDQ